jgi:hypothetical protein
MTITPAAKYKPYIINLLKQNGGILDSNSLAKNIPLAMKLTAEDLSVMESNGQCTWYNRMHWAKTSLQNEGMIKSLRRGVFALVETDQEDNVLTGDNNIEEVFANGDSFLNLSTLTRQELLTLHNLIMFQLLKEELLEVLIIQQEI